jgi:hypothetical protein
MKTPAIFLTNSLLWAVAAICPAQVGRSVPKAEMTRQLEEIGRVATVMVDGDVCRRIMTKRGLEFMTKIDPRDRSLPGDNFDVNDEPYIQTKKTLIRLSRLASFPCDVNLWMPLEGVPGKIQILIRNVHEISWFWRGGLSQDSPPHMKTVLETGKRFTLTDRPGWIAVLAPVYDSLGDIAGLVEVVSQEKLDAQEDVK